MKRCPDCGFRANDVVCPLCGVRMQAAPEIQTHVHRQTGERCGVSVKEKDRRPDQFRPAAKPKEASNVQFSAYGDLVKLVLKVIGYLAAFFILTGGCSAFL